MSDKKPVKQESEPSPSTDSKNAKESESIVTEGNHVNRAALPHLVVVHPLVLLSVVDHYTRVAKDTARRVVGVLLGEINKGRVDVTNSYALPFEEDPKDNSIWYVDRQYHEDMFAMFRKVAAKEKVIGWYSTGPKVKTADLEINELFREYTPDPVYVIIDVTPRALDGSDNLNNSDSRASTTANELPTAAYIAVPCGPEQQTSLTKTNFVHLPSELGALEAEQVGVEHLLRGVKDIAGSSLSDSVAAKLSSLKGLKNRLNDVISYLDFILSDGSNIPVNHQIIYQLQDIINLLPDIAVNPQAVKALAVHTNDNTMVIYLGSLIRSISALHDLISNKIENRDQEIIEHKKHQENKKIQREQEKLKLNQLNQTDQASASQKEKLEEKKE